MSQEVAAQRPPQSHNHERHDQHRHERVRRQNCEIDWPRNSLSGESRGAMVRVIDNVRNQEQNGSRQRRKLATAMRQHATMTNEIVTAGKKNKTGSVERGVEMWEYRVEISHWSRSSYLPQRAQRVFAEGAENLH